MRMTLLKGVEDDIDIDLGSDVRLIGAIIKIGKALEELVYEVNLTGAEVLKLLNAEHYRYINDVCDDIIEDHHYILTAFDY